MSIVARCFALGRRLGKHPVVSPLFVAVWRFLPLERCAQAEGVLAVMHPRPAWPGHVLVLPTTRVAGLIDTRLSPDVFGRVVRDMIALAHSLDPSADNRWLLINGGTRQDIGHLHGHVYVDAASGERSELPAILGQAVHVGDLDSNADLARLRARLRSLLEDPDCGLTVIVPLRTPPTARGRPLYLESVVAS